MSDLEELARKVDALTGPDHALDFQIAKAAGVEPVLFEPIPNQCQFQVPFYTTSVDAAMTLLPEGWLKLERRKDGWSALALAGPWCHASTPALAICAAALRALATLQSTGGEG